MATRGPSYGLSRDINRKLQAKYDYDTELVLREWISDCVELEFPSETSFADCLKDGIILCKLMKKLDPESVKKKFPHEGPLNAFRCMENISEFLRAAEAFGVAHVSLFQTSDLFDESNMSQIQICLLALVDAAKSKGITDIDIGLRIADKQTRDWTEEQLRAGEGIIGLQAGTNKCASQSGMTAYGAARPAYAKKYTGKGEDDEMNGNCQ